LSHNIDDAANTWCAKSACSVNVQSTKRPTMWMNQTVEYEATVLCLQSIIDSHVGCYFLFGGDFNIPNSSQNTCCSALNNFCTANNIVWLDTGSSDADPKYCHISHISQWLTASIVWLVILCVRLLCLMKKLALRCYIILRIILQLLAILNLVSMPQTAVTQITEVKSYTGIGVTHQYIRLIMMILCNTHILPELRDVLALAKALAVAVGCNAV